MAKKTHFLDILSSPLCSKSKYHYVGKIVERHHANSKKLKSNRSLKVCNLHPALYRKSHSFRIRAATWAAAKGFSDSQIE